MPLRARQGLSGLAKRIKQYSKNVFVSTNYLCDPKTYTCKYIAREFCTSFVVNKLYFSVSACYNLPQLHYWNLKHLMGQRFSVKKVGPLSCTLLNQNESRHL